MPDPKSDASQTSPMKRLRQLTGVGNIWLYILSIIKNDGKAYAYALDREMERRFGIRPSRVMIYIVLYRLEAEGLIKAEMEERRKYYRLTKKGENALRLAKLHLLSLSKKL